MKALVWTVMLSVLLVGVGFGAEGEAENGDRGSCKPVAQKRKIRPWRGYVSILRLETIGRKLGDGALNEEQQTQIRILREETIAKVKAWLVDPETVEARENVAVARASGDRDAYAEARAKLKEVGDGEEFVKAYRDGLAGILTENQMAKLYPPKKAKKEECNTQ
jgi:hypothetical protein